MPATPNPRINVVVTPRQHSVLMELGALQGRSASSFLRELLDVAFPVFEASLPPLRAAAKAAKDQPDKAREILEAALAPSPGSEEDDAQLSLTDFILHLARHMDSADGADRSASEDRTARTDQDDE